MTRLTINLPDDVARDLEELARAAGRTPGEHVVQLIAALRASGEHLERMLLEGLDSGQAAEMTPQRLAALDKQLQSIIDQRRSSMRDAG